MKVNIFLDYQSAKVHYFFMTPLPKKTSHGGKRAGAGRKPRYENPVMIAARVPAKICDKLDRFAEANGLTRSEAVVEAVRRLRLARE